MSSSAAHVYPAAAIDRAVVAETVVALPCLEPDPPGSPARAIGFAALLSVPFWGLLAFVFYLLT
ncbi:MAG: hypothetical protein U1E70_21440 [Acetobacteraceae bacterium]|nr:hypothetical protein [Pseudomonadota bacterium]